LGFRTSAVLLSAQSRCASKRLGLLAALHGNEKLLCAVL